MAVPTSSAALLFPRHHPQLGSRAGYWPRIRCLNVPRSACSLSTVAFLVISVCSYGLFGAKSLHPDILRNFTVKALSPLVWTPLAQACERGCRAMCALEHACAAVRAYNTAPVRHASDDARSSLTPAVLSPAPAT